MTVHNGDIVFGDVDGVLIIPREIMTEVIERALEKASTDKVMRKAVEGGMPVTEALHNSAFYSKIRVGSHPALF